MNSEAARVLFGYFEIPENGSDRVTLLHFDADFRDLPATRRRDAHGRLLRLDFDDVLVCVDLVAHFERKVNDRRLGDTFAKLRLGDWNAWNVGRGEI